MQTDDRKTISEKEITEKTPIVVDSISRIAPREHIDVTNAAGTKLPITVSRTEKLRINELMLTSINHNNVTITPGALQHVAQPTIIFHRFVEIYFLAK